MPGTLLTTIALTLCSTQLALAQQAHVTLDWRPQKNTRDLVPFLANTISPEVTDEGMVTFRVKAPDAKEVRLAAPTISAALDEEFEPRPFTKGTDGIWTLAIGPVPPNIYTYRLVVDGVAVADPSNTLGGVTNQPVYSVLVVHGEGPAYYDARPVPHGLVTRHVYHSEVLDGEREIYVYTPPGYERSKRYPVLYLLGGSGELASGWWLDGRASFIADNLLAEGGMEPMIIAMPNNQVLHRSDPKHAELTFDLFERELRTHIVPLVENHYSVQADRRGRAIAGLSMGGRHAQIVGFNALDLFASFGILSAGVADANPATTAFLNAADVNDKVDYLLVGLGTHENQPTNRSVVFHELLEKHGVEHDYVIGGNGGHDWATWRYLLYEALLPNLFRRDR